eukprot:TRINITY_DN2365_c0_g2_i9.p1 TRINITY_DN2365_c0_g2~~TRINITY_DN2365_c0_g2_i9.p1  ORF type:complete len:338 (+),score=68.77 TRINITY_DN2365_c0_g2_i9:649-1662(+)
MKLVNSKILRNVTLVDSPGMLDALGDGRGYNFTEAVRWFVERADIVVAMWDPEKPATTGETLQVFTDVLSGINHKLLLVMNKIDTIQTISDALRVFGTFCWNMSKVISHKDMPYIYTSYLPGKELSFERSFKLSEFDKTRDEILKKVREVPKKHADNIVTELKRHTEHLLLHARIISAVRNEMWWWRLWTVFGMFLVVMLSVGLLAYLYLLHKPRDHYELGLMVSMPIIVTLFCVFLYPLLRRAQHSSLITVEHLRKTFETIYATELLSAECDVYERSWSATNAMILNVINKFGLLSFPSISKREILSLEQVRDKHVQEMLDEIHRNISKLTRNMFS